MRPVTVAAPARTGPGERPGAVAAGCMWPGGPGRWECRTGESPARRRSRPCRAADAGGRRRRAADDLSEAVSSTSAGTPPRRAGPHRGPRRRASWPPPQTHPRGGEPGPQAVLVPLADDDTPQGHSVGADRQHRAGGQPGGWADRHRGGHRPRPEHGTVNMPHKTSRRCRPIRPAGVTGTNCMHLSHNVTTGPLSTSP